MSRIGRKPVALPSGVSVSVSGNTVTVQGPKGKLSLVHLPEVSVKVETDSVIVERRDDSSDAKARHGLTRQLIANMVMGVSNGFSKQIEIIGVGYKAQIAGKKLNLNLGFSHPVQLDIPEGVTIVADEKNKNLLTIAGIDKHAVGQFAAVIRELRPPEPYKGKGIRYTTEFVRRKAGKAAGGGAKSA